MRKTLALILSLCAAYGVFLFGIGAAHSAPTFERNLVSITTDNGKPSQWSKAVTPPEVKVALSKSWVQKKLNTSAMEAKMKREADRMDDPLSLVRDHYACRVGIVPHTKTMERCISSLKRYDPYVYHMMDNGRYMVNVKSGLMLRSLDGPGR